MRQPPAPPLLNPPPTPVSPPHRPDFGSIVATNAFALVTNTAVGFLDSASKVLGTASKGLKKLNVEDPDAAAAQRGGARRQRPRGVIQGVVWGGQALGHGLVTAATGIVVDPIRGGARNGLLGVAQGLAGGTVGIVTKPAAGILDLLTLTMRGAVATLSAKSPPTRDRLPRFVGSDGALTVRPSVNGGGRRCQSHAPSLLPRPCVQPYSVREAEGAARLFLLLQQAAVARAFASGEDYVLHGAVAAFKTFSAMATNADVQGGVIRVLMVSAAAEGRGRALCAIGCTRQSILGQF